MLRLSSLALVAVLAACSVAVLAACSGDSSADGGDAPFDAGADLGHDIGLHDLGPTCATACTGNTLCCAGADGGAPFCADYQTDDQNCGGCGIVCAQGRGMSCVASHCVCGLTDVGCTGGRVSFCCPARSDAGVPYCANLDGDGTDCDTCGHVCDPAVGGACSGGTCYCGAVGRIQCGGSATSHCCVDTAGQGACVDFTSDVRHCGRCDRQCALGQRCVSGLCTVGTETCAGGCDTLLTCCHGVCCDDGACSAGTCAPPDAGP